MSDVESVVRSELADGAGIFNTLRQVLSTELVDPVELVDMVERVADELGSTLDDPAVRKLEAFEAVQRLKKRATLDDNIGLRADLALAQMFSDRDDDPRDEKLRRYRRLLRQAKQ